MRGYSSAKESPEDGIVQVVVFDIKIKISFKVISSELGPPNLEPHRCLMAIRDLPVEKRGGWGGWQPCKERQLVLLHCTN